MRFETVTIKDIGKALGLSTSTVSRALRGSYEISTETKKLVLEYAEKINYRPNPIALSLKERRSRAIGIIVSEIANNFFSQAINGIESIAYNRGYHVIISQCHESYQREVVNVQHLASRSVDGLIVSLSSESSDINHLAELHNKGLPIVFFDRVSNDITTHKVIANNYDGAFEATEHLIKLGYKNIAHLTGAPYLSITIERLNGYKSALEKYGIAYNEQLVKFTEHGGMLSSEMEESIASLFNAKAKPDAIFSSGDRLTSGCLLVLKKMNKIINKHIGFVGYTNSNMIELLTPTPNIIMQPAFDMGQKAIELLIQLIESKRPVTEFETAVFKTQLITSK
jgi:LacI family transcriptional regulator